MLETEKLREQISNFDRDTLEEKFFSLFLKYKELLDTQNEEPKNIIQVKPEVYKTIDFSIHKNKRRQQYLHKIYTQDERILNGILNIYLETNDRDLESYLSRLNKKLEIKDQNK